MSIHSKTVWNRNLIDKYNYSGPRYTSYPTALQFTDQLDLTELANSDANAAGLVRPVSLYVHIPYCSHVCYYCACNKIITKRRDRAAPYLEKLHREIELRAPSVGKNHIIEQLHWGGGTPTFINEDEIHDLMTQLRAHFNLMETDQGEYSIEIDPRECSRQKLHLLRYEGFNRISIGVQDVNPEVQQAVNRVQSIELIEELVEHARHLKFKSVNMDLIYGLPLQTPESYARTIERVIQLSPDRLSVFNYAHLPQRFKPQLRINEADLPSPEQKLEILKNSIDQLTQAGYVYIGMDHFAKPDDELALAQQQGQLHRNFQGYTTHKDCDMLALGVSSISQMRDAIFQNSTDAKTYMAMIAQDKSPVVRGLRVTADDHIRGTVIMQLICHFRLDIREMSRTLGVNFEDYFAGELDQLLEMADDGLITINGDLIEVTPTGRLLIRSICMVFDAYIPKNTETKSFSRII